MNFLKYFVFYSKNTEKSKAWYEKVGFEYLRGFDGMYWFKVGEVEIMLHPVEDKKESGDAQYHIHVDDVHTFIQQVKEAGFQPVDSHHMTPINEPVVREWGTDFALIDPDQYTWVFITE